MARNFASGSVSKYCIKGNDKLFWRGSLRWRDDDTSPWRQITKVLTDESGERIPARPGKDDNRGRATAEKALERWRQSLIDADNAAEQAEAERVEHERIEAEKTAKAARLEAQRVSVPDYVDRYLDNLEALQSVEASTMRHYRNTARLIRWEFADTMIQDLTRSMVEAFEVRIMTGEPYRCQPEGKNRRPAGATTVRKAHTMLKTVCDHAIDIDQLIDRNPVRGIKPPKQPHPDKNALDAESMARLRDYLETRVATPVVTGAALALWAGLGPGEACALKWRNVNFSNCSVRIDAAIGDGAGGNYEKEPKVTTRRRTIYMPSQLVDVLKRRRDVAIDECVAAGVPFAQSMYVLGDATGAHYEPLLLSKQWSGISDAEGYHGIKSPRVRFYDLRHSYATTLVENHVDIETVSAMMGHSNVAQTLNTYADATPEAKQAAADKLGNAFAAMSKVLKMKKTGTDDER